MRKAVLFSISLPVGLLFLASGDYGQGGRPIPPGVREADKQSNSPIEPPAQAQQRRADPAKLQQEAQELAKLSADIPPRIIQVNHGEIPKDLADQLQRIEKLAKHLRSEISRP
jgi:hypothetical protein